MPISRRFAAAVGVAVAAGALAAQGPPIRPWRYDEDYRYLLDAEQATGAWWERLAAVPLDDRGDWFASFGGELRLRYEAFRNDAWRADATADHDYLWSRALPYASLRAPGGWRAFVQGIVAFEAGDEDGRSRIDEDRADLLQAFAEVSSPTDDGAIELQAGRILLAYGTERLIGTRYGPNVPLAFDVVRARWRHGGTGIDAFFGAPVQAEVGAFDDAADDEERLWAAYATFASEVPSRTTDLFYIGHRDDRATYNEGAGAEERHTLGLRLAGRDGGWDWNFEFLGQAGRFSGGDIRAWSVASDTGHTFERWPLRPRVALKANVISGDDRPHDGKLETFDALFPKGKYFGEAGVIGPANLMNLHPSVALQFASDWTVELAAASYWRESLGDGIYDNGGRLLRADGDSRSRHVGLQFDVAIGWQPSRMFSTSVSWSALTAGAFVRDTGTDETVQVVAIEQRIVF